MGTMRLFKVWLLIALMVLSGASLSYAQTNTFPSSGDVGIGTTSPTYKYDKVLHLYGVNPAFKVETNDGTGWAYSIYETPSFTWSVGVDEADKFQFSTADGFGSDKVTIDTNGDVGIGTTSPSSKLHVAGDAKITGDLTVDGNIAAKYQDVAEWVPTRDALAPGTVVVIDPMTSNRVLPAVQPYDTRVAGVVSAQPGIILGEGGTDKSKVAHSGRVKVKTDAQYGPIGVGDILVTSATEGYAMRSAPVEVNGVSLHRPRTILGKALEPLSQGKGKILVLLTLQ